MIPLRAEGRCVGFGTSAPWLQKLSPPVSRCDQRSRRPELSKLQLRWSQQQLRPPIQLQRFRVRTAAVSALRSERLLQRLERICVTTDGRD